MPRTIRITQAEAVKERRLTRALKEAALGELARARNPGLERQCEHYREEVLALGMDVDRLRVDLYAAQALVERLTAERDTYRAAAEGRPLERPREREKLPDERASWTWHCRIGGPEDGISPHIHVGFYHDGRPGELFIEVDDADKERIGAMADAAATAFSISLQCGYPLKAMAEKWLGLHGEVHGIVWTLAEAPAVLGYPEAFARSSRFRRDPEVWACNSLLDAIARKLLVRFCGRESFAPNDALAVGAVDEIR